MFQYEDLMWLISFPLVCAIMLWFSLDLAVLVRVGGGRRRRANARRAIERLIMSSPVLTTASVVPSPSPVSTPDTDRPSRRRSSSASPEHACMGGLGSSSGNEEGHGVKHRAASAGAAGTPTAGTIPCHQQRVRQVVVPAALRIATRAVVRRAVVLVGGDFARSPRMQYHAASLARSSLFDEVLLVGLDYGNQLSEDLLMSGEPKPERFVSWDDPATPKGMEHAVFDVQARLDSPDPGPGRGCIVSTQYLIAPPSPPEWLQTVFPLIHLHWVVCTLYRIVTLTGLFFFQTMCATATRINEHGQLLVTDLILIQTPPAVPFVLLVKYLVCPLAFVYNMLLYYGVVVPAAWMNPGAMRDVRQQCKLQSLHFTSATECSADGRQRALAILHGLAHASLSGKRRWVFYPAIVVDWHNFGYTILAQNQRPTAAVKVYQLLEMHMCAGHVNVTVSQAMRRALEHAYPWLRCESAITAAAGVQPHCSASAAASASLQAEGAPSVAAVLPSAVTVLYDVAPSFFRPVQRSRCVRDVLERLLRRRHRAVGPSPPLASASPLAKGTGNGAAYALVSKADLEEMGWGIAGPPAWVYADAAAESVAVSALPTPAAAPATMAAVLRRGIMVVGSTSWTEDDDYSMLIQALQRLDHRLRHEVSYRSSNGEGSLSASSGPADLWVLITGKGDTRQRFEDAVRVAKLSSHVVVSTYYAQSYQEYSLLLGAADVGLCLHFSSSGLDLPMKGVDMVGSGLPIMAMQYPAIGELIGGVTRVLATQAMRLRNGAADAQGTPRVSSGYAKAVQPTLHECERGWSFSNDADLEFLLSSFIGLPSTSESVGDGASSLSRSPPTPLSVMKQRAYEARRHAHTWEQNWRRVLLPVLKQVV
ncbi:putative dolichyl-P-Man:GDP-ManGlcNAc2-PP-dolichyl beta-1,4-mannosyltransferase [Leishmania major strain Friedlin]|uniref:Putative dolichyl-P-Man:GDP-ManGlcNAc2-PP-dolichyl beta-1,4-mannosyltransferase n=1 Tax=Leishmania major TaxID=5664 RepID=Q4QDV2_LEIMA|nr:putative dolichyl-P-Man:GDP-ManGlcNAc2-PP-dolichyl beta-1,4-mannosyltransferase [Leishmania major strain Friedlin]CAG9572475.1 dolichyl-P-Man:GDP-ManGlcNAc2-PP-dolichyl_beta-1_-4-mannosyltransferase_-_putative [Leishmania major strain Friedlin]CAJ03816.1 putative dolichyl-P-Man:GDP-ManGlcNAc2-PP-dolichyl beta-1,4-mannosyltransferase [Leishmania major strain Friedlin]|eukprot:XP_001682496.1 putative dolichyl-P-Man:GDP-ManGlcNAc2-PP-dolichyl beta-1,4-mannosyltransferase [Leishmania major strain Friedlin]